MKAVRIHEFGPEEVLVCEEAPNPVPAAGEALVRVRAAALNHVDLDIRAGTSRMPLELPAILGLEFAGEVAALPPGAETDIAEGDPVAVTYTIPCGACEYCQTGRDNICSHRQLFGVTRPGAYAEFVAAPIGALLLLPDGFGPVAAAASQVAFSTAWHVLITRARLRPAQTVLIHAAGSGIGSAALQVASLAGARTIATASSAEKLARASRFADEGIDYTDPQWPQHVLDLTEGLGVDIVMSHVGGDEYVGSMQVVKADGVVVIVGAHAGEVVPLDLVTFFRREVRQIGSSRATRREIKHVLGLAASGVLEPQIHRTYLLDEAATAHRDLASRAVSGKLILEV